MSIVNPAKVFEVMGGSAIMRRRRITTESELQAAVDEGLPKRVLPAIFEKVVDKPEVTLYTYRIVSKPTYSRRQKLTTAEGEKAERIARIIALADFVWSDHEKAKEWLNRPHRELEGKTPLQMSLSSIGARRVEEILNRILYGIPA